MLGTILGFDSQANTGTISGNDGKRYEFSKENFKDNSLPAKETKVDFDVNEENEAIGIYIIKDQVAENTNTLMGLLAVGITFFFGFIGTFVSRLILAKEPMGSVIVPTAIHFFITLLVLIPFLGWLIYLGGTLYYMVKNYQLVVPSK